MKKTIGDRIKERRLAAGITQEALGIKTGVSKVTIHKYEANIITNIPSDKIESISKSLNTTPAYLMGWEEPPNVVPLQSIETVQIPVYGKVPAGPPAEAIEYIEETIDIPAEWTRYGQRYFGLTVQGDSMYPKYQSGDVVIIKEQPNCESGQDCVVYVNGCDSTLKKVIKEPDGIMLQPLNPEYSPKKYDYADELNPVTVLGIVVELRRKI